MKLRVLVGLLLAAVFVVGVTTYAEAHHRCGHKGKVFPPPPSTSAPETTIDGWVDHDSSTAIDEDGSGSETTRVTYSIQNADSAEYALDGGTWTATSASPFTFSVAADGKEHTLSVRAKRSSDGAVDDTPATAKLTMCPQAGCAPTQEPPPSSSNIDYSLRLGYTRWLDPAILNARLDKAKDAGATMVLVPVGWDQLEPSSDDGYSWAYLDNTISAIEARGLKASVQFQASPAWARPDCSSVWCPPRGSTQLSYWNDMLKDVAARYGTRIARYELWNEPNLTSFWPSGPNPAEWAALLRAGYLGAKAGNPSVNVVSGGLSTNAIGFQQATYAEIAKYPDATANNNFFDELGVHPYSHCGSTALPPEDNITSCGFWQDAFGEVDLHYQGYQKLKALMDQKGDSNKKLWLGEYGFSHINTWMTAVPDATRANYLKTAYSLAGRSGYISGLSWYTYQDDTEWNIVAADGTESLTFEAFREVTP